MSLRGTAALANYHDLPDDAHARFNAWHTHEHMPERIGVPGFRRARRYVAVEGRPQYFILYEIEAFAVLSSAPYLARLNDPTPWTREMAARLELTIRAACRVSASLGDGLGGIAATLRLDPDRQQAEGLRARLVETLLPAAMAHRGVVGAHLLEADPEVSAVRTAERSLREGRDAPAGWIVVVEGIDPEVVDAACRALEEPAVAAGIAAGMLTLYRLQFVLEAAP